MSERILFVGHVRFIEGEVLKTSCGHGDILGPAIKQVIIYDNAEMSLYCDQCEDRCILSGQCW